MRIIMSCFASVFSLAIVASCGGGGGGSSSPPANVPTNNAPFISSANEDQTAIVGEVFNYDATQNNTVFSDADGDTLSYSVDYAPSANGLIDNNGFISGTPLQAGTYSLTITADDSNGGVVTDVFLIDVAAATTSAEKPNILLIISDDQGQDSSAQYNLSTDLPITPVLNDLASNGLVFENAWVNPSCSPTRAGLISGRYGYRTGVLEPGDALMSSETSLQNFFKSQSATSGYSNAMIGKWHLGGGDNGPNDAGIDHFVGIIGGGVGNYNNWSMNVNGTTNTVTTYTTTELTDQAINWVNSQSSSWFLWLSYNAPHTPFHLPPSGLHNRVLSGAQADIDANPRPYYLAAIEAMDTEIGRLLSSMSVDERENTLIIYLGDNGTPQQVRDITVFPNGSKGSLTEGGVRVPMFVSGKGVTRIGERETALVNNTDFFVTIAQIAGSTTTALNDSMNFSGLLTSDTGSGREFNYSENVSGWTIRGPRYKLVELLDGTQTLFDLDLDPTESTDLLGTSTDVTSILNELEAAASAIRQ